MPSKSFIKNKRVLVTGGAGSIGSELVRQLSAHNKVFILDISERAYVIREELRQDGRWVHSRTGDIRHKDTLYDVFSDFKPQIVFNAAALKHVTPNNEYPEEAFATNLFGTLNLIHEAKNWECLDKFVQISTDKVVNAKGIMGISKLAAESVVRLQDDRFVAVRFGNVMASSGSVLEIWAKQVSSGKPITITDKRMKRYMMTIPEACALAIKATKIKGRLVIFDMGAAENIWDLKIRLYGDYPTRIIGIREGEVLEEGLMTQEESGMAKKVGDFFVIP